MSTICPELGLQSLCLGLRNDEVIAIQTSVASRENPPIMTSSDEAPDLTASGITLQSDSENYGQHDFSSSPDPSDAPPMILYRPPTIWGLLRGAAINLVLPFVNGLMLGFGELFAHEIAFNLGWSQTKVRACDYILCALLTQAIGISQRKNESSDWTWHRSTDGSCTRTIWTW